MDAHEDVRLARDVSVDERDVLLRVLLAFDSVAVRRAREHVRRERAVACWELRLGDVRRL